MSVGAAAKPRHGAPTAGWTRTQRIKNAILYALARGTISVLQRLPATTLRAAGRAVGRLAYVAFGPARRTALANVARALHTLPPAARTAIVRRCYTRLGEHLGDTLALLGGAPFAPLFHAAMAADLPKPLLVINIGGVANITYLGGDGSILACDAGPGNGPLDDLAMRHLGTPYDTDGALAASGQVDEARLAELLAHPYFAFPAPKSLDRLTFSALIARATEGLRPADAAATLAAFSTAAIAGVNLPAPPVRVLVAGGGRHNPVLMAGLAARFAAPVQPVEAAGWDGDALEAQCFAYLAVRSVRGLPLSLPTTTGVPYPMPGGRVREYE